MGLDTVELVISFENAFGIQIPDSEAGKVYTVVDVTMWFYNHLDLIEEKEPSLEHKLLQRIENTLKEMGLMESYLSFDNKLNTIFLKHDLKKNWRKFESSMDLKLPKLNASDFAEKPIESKKFLGISINQPKPPFLESDIKRLIECMGGLNYEKLVNLNSISSLFEVKIVVMGITLDKLGVEMEEVFWDSSFTDDLGAD